MWKQQQLWESIITNLTGPSSHAQKSWDVQYLECLDSKSCSFMDDFLRWTLSSLRDLGGSSLGESCAELVRCAGTLRDSLPAGKEYCLVKQNPCHFCPLWKSAATEQKLCAMEMRARAVTPGGCSTAACTVLSWQDTVQICFVRFHSPDCCWGSFSDCAGPPSGSSLGKCLFCSSVPPISCTKASYSPSPFSTSLENDILRISLTTTWKELTSKASEWALTDKFGWRQLWRCWLDPCSHFAYGKIRQNPIRTKRKLQLTQVNVGQVSQNMFPNRNLSSTSASRNQMQLLFIVPDGLYESKTGTSKIRIRPELKSE